MFFSPDLCLLTFCYNLASDSDGVINLYKVVCFLIILQEMWLQRLFLWLTGLPTQILCSVTQDEQGENLLSPFHGMLLWCVLCCQPLHSSVLRYKTNFLLWYVTVLMQKSQIMQILCAVFCFVFFFDTVWPLPWHQRPQNAMNASPQFPVLWTLIRETR